VFSSLAVSPVRPLEYVMAKAASLAMVSLAAAILVQLGSGGRLDVYFIPAIVLSAMLFTLAGLCIGARRSTLNGFLLATVPAELALMLPALAWRFAGRPGWLLWHPGVLAMYLLEPGPGSPSAPRMAPLLVVGLAAWMVPAAVLAVRRVHEMIIRDAGGGGTP
jgi:fluoroquinolone transport system permease protein